VGRSARHRPVPSCRSPFSPIWPGVSDHADAMPLANILRVDAHIHRQLPAESELVQAIAVLARQQDAVWRRKPAPARTRAIARHDELTATTSYLRQPKAAAAVMPAGFANFLKSPRRQQGRDRVVEGDPHPGVRAASGSAAVSSAMASIPASACRPDTSPQPSSRENQNRPGSPANCASACSAVSSSVTRGRTSANPPARPLSDEATRILRTHSCVGEGSRPAAPIASATAAARLRSRAAGG